MRVKDLMRKFGEGADGQTGGNVLAIDSSCMDENYQEDVVCEDFWTVPGDELERELVERE